MCINTDHDLLEEQYDALTAIIKSHNPDCKTVLSKRVVQRGDVDVSVVNKIIQRLSFHHNIDYVDYFRAFFDRPGKLITRFLNERDNIYPYNTICQTDFRYDKLVCQVGF